MPIRGHSEDHRRTETAFEKAMRQRVDNAERQLAEERAEWDAQREAYIRDVMIMAKAAGVDFDAPEAMADAIARQRRERDALSRENAALREALAKIMGALWVQERGRDRVDGVALTFCERCEEAGGNPDRDAGWRDVPHAKACLYTIARTALSQDKAGAGEG